MNLHDLFPNASASFLHLNRGATPIVESDPRDAPLEARKVQKGDSRRFLVRVKSFRKRLIDEDNLCEKYHVDLLRYAGILSSDDPAKAKIEVCQEKVGSKETERIEITVHQLP